MEGNIEQEIEGWTEGRKEGVIKGRKEGGMKGGILRKIVEMWRLTQ
jgi:hypothetical protein